MCPASSIGTTERSQSAQDCWALMECVMRPTMELRDINSLIDRGVCQLLEYVRAVFEPALAALDVPVFLF